MKKKRRKTRQKVAYPFQYMNPGDSFIYMNYSITNMNRIVSAFHYRSRTAKPVQRIAVRKIDGKIRVWKTKGKRTLYGVNKTRYKIEKNIPLAKPTTISGRVVYPFIFMKAGDSFIYGNYTRMKMILIRGCFSAYVSNKNLDWKCSVRKINGKLRIWKTKGDKITNRINRTGYRIDKNIPLPPMKSNL